VPTTVDVAMKGVMLVLARCADKLVGNFVFYGRSSEEADGGADAGAAPDYPDAGPVRLRPGCPLTVRYSVR
jgi:hypothetical protein